MNAALRKIVFAVPFGCLVALATHGLRFGDDHAFGGEANAGIVAAAIAGSLAISLGVLSAFLSSGTTMTTGTLAAARARFLVPNAGTLFTLAAAVYYGIEALEGNGIEIGLPTAILAALAALLAVALRTGVALLADIVADMVREQLALAHRRDHLVWLRPLHAQPLHTQIIDATRRLGRAPPSARRLP